MKKKYFILNAIIAVLILICMSGCRNENGLAEHGSSENIFEIFKTENESEPKIKTPFESLYIDESGWISVLIKADGTGTVTFDDKYSYECTYDKDKGVISVLFALSEWENYYVDYYIIKNGTEEYLARDEGWKGEIPDGESFTTKITGGMQYYQEYSFYNNGEAINERGQFYYYSRDGIEITLKDSTGSTYTTLFATDNGIFELEYSKTDMTLEQVKEYFDSITFGGTYSRITDYEHRFDYRLEFEHYSEDLLSGRWKYYNVDGYGYSFEGDYYVVGDKLYMRWLNYETGETYAESDYGEYLILNDNSMILNLQEVYYRTTNEKRYIDDNGTFMMFDYNYDNSVTVINDDTGFTSEYKDVKEGDRIYFYNSNNYPCMTFVEYNGNLYEEAYEKCTLN